MRNVKRDLSLLFGMALILSAAAAPAVASQRSCEDLFRATHTMASAPSSLIRQYEASRSVSQKIRDNAPFYWAEVKAQEASIFNGLPSELRAIVIVIGDLHSGNFSPVLVPGRGVRYTAYDIKDIGYGLGMMDINRLAMNTVEIARRGRPISKLEERAMIQRIIRAYRTGLLKNEYELTERFQDELPSEKKFNRKLAKKLENKLADDGVLEVDGEAKLPLTVAARKLGVTLSELQGQLEAALIANIGWGRLSDSIANIRDRGGSKESLRVLSLFEATDLKPVLKEFKELVPSAVSEYSAQPAREVLEVESSKYLDYDVGELFPVVRIAGLKFVLRDKKLEPIVVPYKQKHEGDFERLMDLAVAHAQWAGTFHGRQLQAAGDRHVAYERAIGRSEATLIDRFMTFNAGHVRRLGGGQ
ncbi:MAG: DUF2252 family protein [Bdellovibrionaceae bacterium]|nr:DUF2252 family protein [Pseudobdellovibrionaceae bacterium]